jgi:hypothetical protein
MRAFSLKADFAFEGGSIAIPPDGHTLDVKKRLDAGGGAIVTDDHVEGEALSVFPALQELTGSDLDHAVQAHAKGKNKSGRKADDSKDGE